MFIHHNGTARLIFAKLVFLPHNKPIPQMLVDHFHRRSLVHAPPLLIRFLCASWVRRCLPIRYPFALLWFGRIRAGDSVSCILDTVSRGLSP